MSRPVPALVIGALGVLAGTLTGCSSSAPVRYFTLEPVPGSAVAAPPAPVRVGPVHLPAVFDHRGLTHERAPGEVSVADSELWAAPLSDLIRDTLTADLGQRLGYERLSHTDALPLPTTRLVSVDFPLLIADAHCSVSLRAIWTIRTAGPPAAVSSAAPASAGMATSGTAASRTAPAGAVGAGTVTPEPALEEVRGDLATTAPAATCPEGLSAALSQALGSVSDGIAAAVAGFKP
jgi:uncharacterized lipoprotein YmbA